MKDPETTQAPQNPAPPHIENILPPKAQVPPIKDPLSLMLFNRLKDISMCLKQLNNTTSRIESLAIRQKQEGLIICAATAVGAAIEFLPHLKSHLG